MIRVGVHVLITALTVYLGYRLFLTIDAANKRAALPVAQRQPQSQPQDSSPAPLPRPARRALEMQADPVQRFDEDDAAPSVPPPAPVPLDDAIDELPHTISLPSRDDRAVSTILVTDAAEEISFEAFDETVFRNGNSLMWVSEPGAKPTAVAGLRMADEGVQFCWTPAATNDAEVVIRNSLVVVSKGEAHHAVALREPTLAEPLTLDLTKGIVRIPGRCDWQPPAERMYFSISGTEVYPYFDHTGADLNRISLGEEALLLFKIDGEAANRIRLDRQGRAVLAELEFRYVLPSGDTEGMSIPSGNSKRRELARLLNAADAAEQALPGMRRHYLQVQKNLQRYLAPGQGLNSPAVLHPAREVAASRLRSDLGAMEDQISRAEDLVANRPIFAADMASLEKVAELARSLHELDGFSYSFFIEVNGHPITLIRSRPDQGRVKDN